ncbi:hypothetical protein ZIOFF_004012 [Zingiber officinale]|uniref:Xaa-Pro dipeptidase n=1 Tax=Zingiber officinale TaxID=94328 RepID=A0A8J5MAY2_ZINOF|nr:hypothetical protein ZIOFF_004012 [Zingiber officinale]
MDLVVYYTLFIKLHQVAHSGPADQAVPMASCATVLSPPEVPMELHALNRDKLVQAMRDNLAASSRPVRGFVVLQGGEEQTRYCSDHALLFRQESYFAYLFGVREPGFFGAILHIAHISHLNNVDHSMKISGSRKSVLGEAVKDEVDFKDVASGKSILFAPRLPDDYAVWLGEIKPPSVFKERYMVDMVFYVDELVQVLHSQSDKQGKPLLFLLYGLNTDSNNFSKPAEIEDIEKFDTDLSTLHPILTECRVIKSKMELDIIQYANDVSSEAHIELGDKVWHGMDIPGEAEQDKKHNLRHNLLPSSMPFFNFILPFTIMSSITRHNWPKHGTCYFVHGSILVVQMISAFNGSIPLVMRQARVGMKEYQLESIFLHHVYMYGGCRHCSYTCICATGENSAVLHYGHASAPNDRVGILYLDVTLEDGDIALFDMGAEYHFYGSDITCSFPVNGKFTKDQATIYNAVLAAHNAVIESMRPGVCWIDMHELAEKTILESLKNRGIVLGDIDKMMELRLGAIFMPHGLGHLLGIDTHDPGGYAQGLERPKEPGLKALRTIRKLQEGMVITVEPGCYFIDALLIPAMEDTVKSKFLNREEIAKYRKFGGVRIESDVLVTADGSRNFTNCPRQTWEIEAVMAGAPWPVTRSSIKS